MCRFPLLLTFGFVVLNAALVAPAPGQATEAPAPVQAPAATITELDVVYGESPDGQKLLLDLFQPVPAPKLHPAVLLVHGGGWTAGSRNEFRGLALVMARMGYVAVPVEYRLTSNPANVWPAQLDDVQLAVRWLRANAGKYGIDPRRIGAMGTSAGGHLVACLGLRDTRDPATAAHSGFSSRVNCVVDVCGPTDLTDDFAAKVKQGAAVNELVTRLLGGTRQEKADAARDASPLFLVDAGAPSFFIIHGRLDDIVPLDHSQRLHEALARQGISSQILIFDDDGHGFTQRANQERFVKDSLAFFAKHLGP